MTATNEGTARCSWALGFALIIGLAAPGVSPAIAQGSRSSAGLDAALGQRLFKRNWVPAPSSTKSNDGLGPLFNARSCLQCHAAATAGRIETGDAGALAERGTVVRLAGASGAPDPAYGAQIQTRAIAHHTSEARVRVTWAEQEAVLADGTRVALRRPTVTLQGLKAEPALDTARALVLAPSLAAAAQIAQVDLHALQQQSAKAGRLSRGPDDQVLVFGRKATEPSLHHAIETAFARDLGMSTRGLPYPAGDCTAQQTACRGGPHGDDSEGIEIAPPIVAALTAYVASLAPATQAAADHGGEALFEQTGCAACHQPELPGKSGKLVTLYSDLRLYDMGAQLEGIADAQGQTAREWRTAPLLGLQKRLDAGSTLLHDGRARSVEEAVLWHGGQAQTAREAYARLSADERTALQDFVASR